METVAEANSLSSPKDSPLASAESVKGSSKPVKPNVVARLTKTSGTVSSVKKKTDVGGAPSLSMSRSKSILSNSSPSTNVASLQRRNSIAGLAEKKPSTALKRQENGAADGKKVSPSVSDPPKRSTPESRRSSLASVTSKSPASVTRMEMKKVSPVSRLSSSIDSVKSETTKKTSIKPASATPKKIPSSSMDSSTSRNSLRRVSSNVSSPSTRSPSITSSSKLVSSPSSFSRSSSITRKKTLTADSRDSRFMMLPQVDVKAGDELRLDLRGHRVRSLNALKLSPNLEFIYLRDNLLSSVDGIETLKRVKVLDLSFNDFKGPGFEPLGNCKALQQLYLAGNQITSLASLPELPNLEFLSVAQNRLKSLSMASQPRLQVLAASKNKISSLKGFPHLPFLEHLRVEGNPILEMPHLEAASILLVGPTLKKFNDRDLSPSEVGVAKLYPAHTALCIREGWEFCRPELASDSTFSFLVEQWKDHLPSGYVVKEAYIDQPFEEDVCLCHFKFTNISGDSELVLKYQWFIGDRTPANFVPIADAVGEVYWPKHEDVGRCLKVECTPILTDAEFPSIFAVSSPVSPGTGYPKVINLGVHGDLTEGNVIKGSAEVAWCGGTPGKGVASWLRRRWNSPPVVIVGAEDEEYRLTINDIDSSLVFMYTPVTKEGVKGEPQYAMTEFVKAAAPSVSNVRILGEIVEGNTIKGTGEYFGGKEGPSKFEWLREKENGEFLLVSSGTTEYTLTKEDVGLCLKFVYIPMNFEGQEGESVSTLSEIVKKAPPKVTNLKIVGELREGNKVTVAATVTGGTDGSSRVQWFKTTSSKLEGELGLEAVSTSKVAKAFRVPLAAVGYYIVAKFTPMAPDGEAGEPAYAISENAVETLPPSLNFLTLTGEFLEGEILTASYGYIGGHEGKSLYDWYLHETKTSTGEQVPEASGLLQYRISKEAIGKFISFRCTPIRDDGTVGEPRTFLGQEQVRPGSPRLLSLHLMGEGVEGTTLVAKKKYWGGEEGDSIFRWFLTSSDGTQREIEGATTESYMLTCNDIGFLVSVSCEPVRRDWAHGPVATAKHIGPIVPGPPTCRSLELLGSVVEGGRLSFAAEYSGGERGNCTHEWFRVKDNDTKGKLTSDEDYVDLTLEHVGERIELVYTPARIDGLRGTPKSIISDFILPADPKGIEIVLPVCSEDNEIVPLKCYFGGKEGIGKYIWYRMKEKLAESELVNLLSSSHGILIVGETLRYKPSLEDVGSYLVLYWVPTRADGKIGDPLVAISNHPVMAAPPIVSKVCLKEIKPGVFAGEGVYYGGYEGSSLYSWYRESNEGNIVLISGANSTTYEVTDSDYNCHLLFGYTPVRSDGVAGELRLSEPSDIILPELPKIEVLSFKGKEIEGELLTAVEIIPESEVQQNIWGKYKKETKYQWFCSVGAGEDQTFEALAAQTSCSYRVRTEDIGRCLKCECIVIDVFGRSSELASAVTAPISPGIPKIAKLEIEGRGYHTNLYAVRGIYSGGKEGKSKIQWLRSMVGSPDLISIPGEVGRMYEANVDDVGYRLVAVYTPIREDGVEGQPVSASTEPISVEPEVYKEVKQKLELGSVKFEVLCDKDRSSKKVPGVGELEKRILEVNKKRVKVVKPGSKTSFPTTEVRGTFAPPFHVELYRNEQHRFKIVVDGENEVDLMVQTRHMRDIIILVIRGLAQRFNSTSLNSLLKIDS